MARPRIVFDTNIYISAILFGGIPEEILSLCRSGLIEVCISDPIVKEITTVLTKKFSWDKVQVQKTLETIAGLTSLVEINCQPITAIKCDDSDNRILETAISANADIVVSGDSHLLALNKYTNIKIVTAKSFLEKGL